jgi:hypothetical protein
MITKGIALLISFFLVLPGDVVSTAAALIRKSYLELLEMDEIQKLSSIRSFSHRYWRRPHVHRSVPPQVPGRAV